MRGSGQLAEATPDLFDFSGIAKSVQGAWVNTPAKSVARTEHPSVLSERLERLGHPVSVGGMDKNYGSYRRISELPIRTLGP